MQVSTPEAIHTIAYRSSGASQPEDHVLEISIVRYLWTKHSPCFLVASDLQGREIGKGNRLLGEQVAEELAVLIGLGQLPALDLCLLCGDFFDYPDCHKRGGSGDITSVLNAFGSLAPRTIAVLGNHDEISAAALGAGVDVLDGGSLSHGGLRIGGVSGIVGNPSRSQRKTEGDFLRAVDRALRDQTDILLLHQGPEGPDAASPGWGAINAALRSRGELLTAFGHSHWPSPFHQEGRTTFCNADSRVLIFQSGKGSLI